MTVGENIQEMRREMRITIDELARRVGCDRFHIREIEAMGDHITVFELRVFARALHTAPMKLIGFEDLGKYNNQTTTIGKDRTE